MNPPANLSISGIREQLSMVTSVTAPDALTVEFTLAQPTPFFLEVLAGDSMIIYSAEELEANDFDLRGVTVPLARVPSSLSNISRAKSLFWKPMPTIGMKICPMLMASNCCMCRHGPTVALRF